MRFAPTRLSCRPLFLLFEPDRLYQPELVSLWTLNATREELDLIRDKIAEDENPRVYAFAEGSLLRDIQASVRRESISMNGFATRFTVKDNLVTTLAYLAASGVLRPLAVARSGRLG